MNCLLFTIKRKTVLPKKHVKVLDIVINAKLQYKQHIAKAVTKDLEAAMNLRRLRDLFLSTARHLFTATVVSVIDYASNI